MPVSKLKNLAILILLLANLALLAMLVPSRLATRQEAEQMRAFLSQLCAAQDVALDPDSIPDTASLYALELGEDAEADLRAATALLGQEVLAQDDSTRYQSLYSSADGTCQISRSGAFSAKLQNQPEDSDLTGATTRILKEMGFTAGRIEDPVRVRAGVYTVTAWQSVLDVPVLSGGLTLTYSNNCLTGIDGVFFTSAGQLTRVSEEVSISAADAVVAFLDVRYDLGWVGSAIESVVQGYARSETAAAAAVHLTPVWRLETDTGVFQVNGLTREVTAVLP